MKSSLARYILPILFFSLCGAASALPFSNIYVLGDSLSDQGNLYAATTALHPPGVVPIPAADHYFQGRFSNGEVYAGRLANKLDLTSSASATGGNNFAYGGARTTYNRVEVSAPLSLGGFLPTGAAPWSLELERQAFAARGIHDPNALYVVWAGSNDLADVIPLLLTGNNILADQFMTSAVTGVKDVVDTFLNAGARTILVPNMPDLGLVPSILARDPLFPGAPPHLAANTATAVAQTFNALVDAMLNTYTGVNIVRYDSFNFLRDVVANPAAFGFSNATQPCYTGFVGPAGPTDTVCAAPDTYVFWDAEHPTAAFHNVIADKFYTAVVPEPSIVLLFSGGLIGLWCATRRRRGSKM